ncbi:MAG: beta-propeller fold lactonase family protein [Lachnospiraceae bacterium]|nr:beta-propeller fold lactonase family protein [Lachnospiraceae bacterium]
MDNKLVCISMRGENRVYVFKNDGTGFMKLAYHFTCGRKPCSVKLIGKYLYVLCQEDSTVEVYKVGCTKAELLTKTSTAQPVAFITT